jgi:hypothetical protein
MFGIDRQDITLHLCANRDGRRVQRVVVVQDLDARNSSSHAPRDLNEKAGGDLAANATRDGLPWRKRLEAEVAGGFSWRGRVVGLLRLRGDESNDDEPLIDIFGHNDKILDGLALGEFGSETLDGDATMARESRVRDERLDATGLKGEDDVGFVKVGDLA